MFEAPMLVKPLLWVLAAQGALYLLALRPWRVRELPRALAPSIDLFFLALLALGVAALVEPRPFDRASAYAVRQTSLPDSVAVIDEELASLEAMPERVWEEIKSSFGFAEPPPVVPPAAVMRPGAIESAVVGAVEEIVSAMMRAYVYVAAVLSLWMTIVMRLFVRSSTARRLRDARAWQAMIDERQNQRLAELAASRGERASRSHAGSDAQAALSPPPAGPGRRAEP